MPMTVFHSGRAAASAARGGGVPRVSAGPRARARSLLSGTKLSPSSPARIRARARAREPARHRGATAERVLWATSGDGGGGGGGDGDGGASRATAPAGDRRGRAVRAAPAARARGAEPPRGHPVRGGARRAAAAPRSVSRVGSRASARASARASVRASARAGPRRRARAGARARAEGPVREWEARAACPLALPAAPPRLRRALAAQVSGVGSRAHVEGELGHCRRRAGRAEPDGPPELCETPTPPAARARCGRSLRIRIGENLRGSSSSLPLLLTYKRLETARVQRRRGVAAAARRRVWRKPSSARAGCSRATASARRTTSRSKMRLLSLSLSRGAPGPPSLSRCGTRRTPLQAGGFVRPPPASSTWTSRCISPAGLSYDATPAPSSTGHAFQLHVGHNRRAARRGQGRERGRRRAAARASTTWRRRGLGRLRAAVCIAREIVAQPAFDAVSAARASRAAGSGMKLRPTLSLAPRRCAGPSSCRARPRRATTPSTAGASTSSRRTTRAARAAWATPRTRARSRTRARGARPRACASFTRRSSPRSRTATERADDHDGREPPT